MVLAALAALMVLVVLMVVLVLMVPAGRAGLMTQPPVAVVPAARGALAVREALVAGLRWTGRKAPAAQKLAASDETAVLATAGRTGSRARGRSRSCVGRPGLAISHRAMTFRWTRVPGMYDP